MKKIALTLLFAATILNASAYDFSKVSYPGGQRLYYNIVNGHAEVVRPGYGSNYNNYVSGDLTIPASVSYSGTNYVVSAIANNAFEGCVGLTSVNIPSSINSIGNWAFANCSGLNTVTIDDGITSIGDHAFYGCGGLISVSIPSGVTTIGDVAFYNVRHIEYYGNATGSPWGARTMNGVLDGEFVFSDNTKHKLLLYLGTGGDVIIPTTVDTIGQGSFSDCSTLASVSIPSTVTSIGSSAFKGCSGLTSVNIPSGITSISSSVFKNCSGLTSITIPFSVTSIGDYAFEGCNGLTAVTIPEGVTHIGRNVFSSCNSLTSISIPDGITNIDTFAFYNCSSITYVLIGNSVTNIGYRAFEGCTSLDTIIIPNSVTNIGGQAFMSCSNLSFASIGNSVAAIGYKAFSLCNNLEKIYFYTDSIPSFGSNVFETTNTTRNLVFYVLCGMKPQYRSVFGNGIGCTDTWLPFDVSATVSNTERGTVQISSCSPTATLTTTENHGYHFSQWSDGDTANPRSVVLTNDTSFTAIFEKNIYNIIGIAHDSTKGEVVGSCSVEYLDSVTLTAVPYYGYHFVGWNPGWWTSDGIDYYLRLDFYDNPITVLVSDDATYSAYFVPNQYQVTLNVNNEFYGQCLGQGIYDYLSEQTIIAVADYGYHFSMWSDGDTNNPRVLTITQDTSLYAIFEKNNYYIVGIPDNTEKGNVIGSDTVEYLDTVVLTATSNYGYHFSRWSDNNTSNPRQIIATQNRTITAIFDYNQYTITLNVDSNILGSTNGGGSYNYLSEQTITATASYGYHFTSWNDGDTNNPRTITLTKDTIFTALFAKNIYSITTISADTIKGAVTGSTSIEYLDSVTITANPNYGYYFTTWNDGNTDNPRTIVATRDSVFTASFGYNQYTITLNVDTDIHGSVIGDGAYNYLSEQTITAMANYGYHFTEWSDGDTNNPRTITLTQDTIFTAQFAKNTYTITAISADTIRGSVIGSTSIEYLDSVTIMANPNYGYHFTAWNDGNTDNPRIIVATRDSVFTASFVYNQYTITLNVDSDIHGSVVGGGSFNYLSEQTIIATANYGYHFTEWSDGDTNNPRTITLTQDTGFTALFAKNQYTLTLQSDDVAHGSVIGGGVFDYLDTVAIEATAVEHYHFVLWNDGNTDNPRQYVLIGNDTLIAIFAIDTHHVSVESCNIAFGSVEGSGDFEYGTPATVTATAYSGYQFVRWSNGDTHNPYTFAVLQDTTLVAIFEAETQGIDDVIADTVNVYTLDGQIVVETELKEEIVIYDIVGRKVDGGRNTHFDVPASGVYLVKIGTMPTQKVVVVK